VKPKNLRFIALGLLVSIALLNVAPNAALANPDTHAPAQIVEPFEEMLPGVYVASMWWNDSGSNLDWEHDDAEPGYFDDDDDAEPGYFNAGGDDDDVVCDNIEYTYKVEDNEGNMYYILEEGVSERSHNWSFSNP
jgi:hypothetical protein